MTTVLDWLAGVRVLELGDSVAAGFATKHLAELGATVRRVGLGGGIPLAARLPRVDATAGPTSMLARYLDHGKELVALAAGEGGAAAPAGHVRWATLVVSGLHPAEARAQRLDRESLLAVSPALLVVEVTDFGQTGPYADYLGGELVTAALSGLTGVTGDPRREPLTPAGYLPSYFGGLNAALAGCALLLGRARGARTQWADVAITETLTTVLDNAIPNFRAEGKLRTRAGNGFGQAPLANLYLYPCRDGYVSLFLPTELQWQGLCLAVDHPQWLDDPSLQDWGGRALQEARLKEGIGGWFAARTRTEILVRFQELRLPLAVAATLEEVLASPQHAFRGFFEDGGQAGPALPRLPFVASLPAAGGRLPSPAPAGAALPLAGIRVLDMTQTWAGPYCTMLLADLGARVVKVESWARPDMARLWSPPGTPTDDFYDRSPGFMVYARGKESVSLDVTVPEGREAFLALARSCDVVIDNFSRRVMPNLGLAPAELLTAHSGLVVLRMPGFGSDGPYGDYVSYGQPLEAIAGVTMLNGYPGGGPMRLGVAYGDPASSCAAAIAVVAALYARSQGGGGVSVDLSQFEAFCRCIGEELLAFQVSQCQPARLGNRHAAFAPHGVYPCRGGDQWVAIAACTDAEWRALCGALRLEELRNDPDLATAPGRKAAEERIDEAIRARTRGEDKHALMARLQAAGVPAGAVLTIPDLVVDPQLAARSLFATTRHPLVGDMVVSGRSFALGPGPLPPLPPAPLFGQHTRMVLEELGGMTHAEIDGLEAAGVVGRQPVTQYGKS